MDRCYTYRGAHIPGCVGCAAMGDHSYCTCPRRGERSIEERVARLEAVVKRLVKTPDPARSEP